MWHGASSSSKSPEQKFAPLSAMTASASMCESCYPMSMAQNRRNQPQVHQPRNSDGTYGCKPAPESPDTPPLSLVNKLDHAMQQLEALVSNLAESCGINQPQEWQFNSAEKIIAIYKDLVKSRQYIPKLSSLQITVEHRDLEVEAIKAAACLIFTCSKQVRADKQILKTMAIVILAILDYGVGSGDDNIDTMAEALRRIRFLLKPSHIIRTVPNSRKDLYSKKCEVAASTHWDLVVAIFNAIVKEMQERHNKVMDANYDGAWLTCSISKRLGRQKSKKIWLPIDPGQAEMGDPEGPDAKEKYLKRVDQAVTRISSAECLDEVADQDDQHIEPASGQQRLDHAGTRLTQNNPQQPTRQTGADDARRDYRNSDAAGSPKGELHSDDGTDQTTRTRPSPNHSDHQSSGANNVISQTTQIEDRDESSRDPDRSPSLGRWIRFFWVWVLLLVLVLVVVLIIGGADSETAFYLVGGGQHWGF